MFRRSSLLYACLVCVLIVVILPFTACTGARQLAPGTQVQGPPISTVDTSHLQLLRWRYVGPSRGGRVVAVAGDPVNKLVFYHGATGGGVWKTTDAGASLAAHLRRPFPHGLGGRHRRRRFRPQRRLRRHGRSLRARQRIARRRGLQIRRRRQDVAQRGPAGTATNRRVSACTPRTPTLSTSPRSATCFGPMKCAASTAPPMAARTWEAIADARSQSRRRRSRHGPRQSARALRVLLGGAAAIPWHFRSGGPGNGLFKSTDGGDTWTDISRNLRPAARVLGRIGVTVSPPTPRARLGAGRRRPVASFAPTMAARPGAR